MAEMRWPNEVDELTPEQARDALRLLRVQVERILSGNDEFADELWQKHHLDTHRDPIVKRWKKLNASKREGILLSHEIANVPLMLS